MIYRSETFELDTTTGDLRRGGVLVPLEPQTYRLLIMLIENQGRLIPKEEIIETIWKGRAITDAALATTIRQVRTAIGDNGADQKYVKTYPKRGFRFIGPVTQEGVQKRNFAGVTLAAGSPLDDDFKFRADSRPSIAVLPFRFLGHAPDTAGVALGDALAHDLIAEIAKSNWLFVIARDSTFQLRDGRANLGAVRDALDARYSLTGEITSSAKELRVYVELAHTPSSGVVWANVYEASLDEVHQLRADIAAHIHSSLERRIVSVEVETAKLTPPENLDAWSLYHIGLDHVYRFTESEALIARRYFSEAIEREPSFARAHAGLSSAHYLCAQFDGKGVDGENARRSRAAAERAVELDPLDPFANFSMSGPAQMAGDVEQATTWAERAIAISPNHSHAITALGWMGVVCGRGEREQELADLAMKLSPLDPMYYGMQVTRVMSHIVRGQFEDAVQWVEKAVATNSTTSPFLGMIVTVCHELNGNHQEARRQAALFKETNPGLDQTAFFQAYPFRSKKHQTMIANALAAHGL